MYKLIIITISLFCGLASFCASPWNQEALFKAPETFKVDIPELKADNGIKPIFFAGVPYRGKATKVFAWYGVPPHKSGKVPGIVLVHGGGGTAYKSWVKLWMDRGYAAIAIDTCGCVPLKDKNAKKKRGKAWTRHEDCGPEFGSVFANINEPIEDQWPYHAVAEAILANSLLRSMPEVDSNRIGITGISWGGFLTGIIVGVDSRFCFAAPVYGCGFLGDNSSWKEGSLRRMGKTKAAKWLKQWDPSNYVGKATMPMLFCDGTNDPHYRPDSWQKTYRLVKTPRTLAMRVRMKHGHPPAGDPPEITVFADSITKNKLPLPEITKQGKSGSNVWVQYASKVPLSKGVLNYTCDSGCWTMRKWESVPAKQNPQTKTFSARLPDKCTAYYFNLYDNRGCLVSSEHQTLSD